MPSVLVLVFVFGPLKEGFPNFATNRGARIPGVFETKDRYPLFLVGERSVPWLIDEPGTGHHVLGQVFKVTGEVLQAMDRLERTTEADGYRRVQLDVRSPDQSTELRVHAYLKPVGQFSAEQSSLGPLREYTVEHAALYRPRAA